MNPGCFDNSFACKNFLPVIYSSTTYTKYVSVLRFSHKRVQWTWHLSLRIQSACGKMQTKMTPNADTFHAVALDEYTVSSEFKEIKTLTWVYLITNNNNQDIIFWQLDSALFMSF